MCGLFGFYLKRPLTDTDINEGVKILNLISHRGPDSTNYYFDRSKGIFLGHTRLSILDLSENNNQPFIKNNNVLIYNGEIYNYKEIKNNYLSKNTLYKTKGDTEVLFELLEKNDFNNLNLIDGMFAFAYLKEDKLYLSRDIYGEKPLYYYQNNNGIYFSSEQKTIIKICKLEKNLEDKNINEFLNFGYNFKNKFYDINEIKNGSILKINNGLIKNNYRFSNIPNLNKNTKFRNIKELNIKYIKELLINSLQNRLYSDIPLGLLLSSGNDSILIACLLKKELNYDIKTVTYSFDDKNYDEYGFVQQFCKFNKIENFKITNNYMNKNDYRKLIDIYDVPNDNFTAFNILKISKVMKKYFSVALTGLGADEIFYGYNKHYFINKYKYILTSSLFKFIGKKINFTKLNKIKKYNFYIYDNYIEILLALKNNPFFNNKKHNNFFLFEEYKDLLGNKDLDVMSFFINFYNNYDLLHSIIPSVERSSMKAGVELRTPYLNKKLHEYLIEFNPSDILNIGNKWIQKSILSEYIPDRLINKRKMGFINPPDSFVSDILLDKNDKNNKDLMQKYKIDKRWNKFIIRKKLVEEFISE